MIGVNRKASPEWHASAASCVFSVRYPAAWSTGMSSSRPLFRTGNSAYRRAGRASSSCPAWASPTSRRSWSPQTCGGSCWTTTEMEETSKGELLLPSVLQSVCFTPFTVCADVVCLFTIPTQMSHGLKISGLSSVSKAERTRTQTTEHKELAMCPSPHIWCAGAGSGLGRRSDQPNEISQHTKCLSGPIRIPSCLPWVYLIDGKGKE